jgi:DNA-binding transcriptional LysR family regulator
LSGTGRIHKWEFQIDERLVDFEVTGNLTVSDSTFGLDAAMEGIGLAYLFEALARPHIRAKRLKRLLTTFSPTFPGFYLYYPNREHQPTKMKALIDHVRRGRV